MERSHSSLLRSFGASEGMGLVRAATGQEIELLVFGKD